MFCNKRRRRRYLLMVLSKITIGVFLAFVFFSVMLSKLQNTFTVDENKSMESVNGSDAEEGNVKPRFDKSLGGMEPVPNGKYRHLMVFMQISDMHISVFGPHERATDLGTFCSVVVPIVKPSVVIASGDLTDAKSDIFGSLQYVEEWKTYQRMIQNSGVLQKTVWLDIRGNHDNFNVPGLNSSLNHFREYSVQGKNHSRSYKYSLKQGSDQYDFVAIDACMDPGPKRPFNFLGVLSKNDIRHIENLTRNVNENNMTIWFGHYSTSTIVSPKPGIRELMRGTGPYLCGHLHNAIGMVPTMYTLQPTGNLELELIDWKNSRKFRVGVVDHGMFSFVDVKLGQWPIVIITNPKHALYTMPVVEPLNRMINSTHIRVLVYDVSVPEKVMVQIGQEQWQIMQPVQGPLYVLPWSPNKYLSGQHTLRVSVTNSSGFESQMEHVFSLDGSRPTFPLLARVILMGHIEVAQGIFAALLVILVLPLCLLRCLFHLKKDEWIRYKARNNWFRKQLFKFYLLACVDRLFWPLIISLIYLGSGPWLIGELVDGYIGAVFAWGIIIKGTYLPGGLTFVCGVLHLLTFYYPLTINLSGCLYRHYRHLQNGGAPSCSLLHYCCRHLVMILIILWQGIWAIFYWRSYGYIAGLLGILTTWSVPLAVVLWRFSVTLPEKCFPRRAVAPVPKHQREDAVWALDNSSSLIPARISHQESKETLLKETDPASGAVVGVEGVNASTHF